MPSDVQYRLDSACEDMVSFILRNSTVEEQRVVIRFLTTEDIKTTAIHRHGVVLLRDKRRSAHDPHVSWVTYADLAKFKWKHFDHIGYVTLKNI
ncbi:hypothetical protein TNCV_4993491 [Trichonephila clavipes]|nr:hypothetical protein TNCV_4993491 [Trichonephila clavipes]